MENYKEELKKKEIFIEKTKMICMCSFVSMFIITLFTITPLGNLIVASKIMNILAIIILGYAIYLNVSQSFAIQNISKENKSNEFLNQININILCSYIFTLLLGFVLVFAVKSLF